MKALKVSVVLMGVLILVGLAVVAITVARRGSAPPVPAESARGAGPAVSPPLAGAAPAGFGEATVTIPAGFAPVETRAEGDRMLIRLEGPGHAARILVIDLRTCHTLGTVVLAPQAP